MKVAIFGGSGFMGYDFFRLLLETGGGTPVVYCTSPKNLSNLARHELDLRFVPYPTLAEERLDSDVDLVVNFAHPFTKRDEMTPAAQTGAFIEFLRKNKEANTNLRLIHISTMSVYEPFAPGAEFKEHSKLDPPVTDTYATTKVKFEQLLSKLPDANKWQLMLRPTIVYGPFCRPWTDGPLGCFAAGDVEYYSLDGRIQPIYGRDISRFIRDRMEDFQSGIYNMGGPATMTWMDFLKFYEGIVSNSHLVREAGAVEQTSNGSRTVRRPSLLQYYRTNFHDLMQDVVDHPAFLNMVVPISKRCPSWMVRGVHRVLGTSPDARSQNSSEARAIRIKPKPKIYCRPFFGQDRLVSMGNFKQKFPEFKFTLLKETTEVLTDYYRYRFTDELFV